MNKISISSISMYYKTLFLKQSDKINLKTRETIAESLGVGTNALKKYLDPLLDNEWISKGNVAINERLEKRFFVLKEDPLQMFEGPHLELIESLLNFMYSEREILGKADRLAPENIILLCFLLSRADADGVSEELSSSKLKSALGLSDAQLKSQITKLRRLKALKILVPGRVFKNIIGRQKTIYQIDIYRLQKQLSTLNSELLLHKTTLYNEHPYALGITSKLGIKRRVYLLGSGVTHEQILAFQKLVDFRLTQYASAMVNDLIFKPSDIREVNADETSFEVGEQIIMDSIKRHFPKTLRKNEATKASMQSSERLANLKPVRNKATANETLSIDEGIFDNQLSNLHQELINLSVKLARICVLKVQQMPRHIGKVKKVHILPFTNSLSGDYQIAVTAKKM